MREIVLDTETTGLDPAEGHRMVEIGMVELENYRPTGRTYHAYFNPQRDMPADAFAIHGLSAEFLSAHRIFAHRAIEIVDFIGHSKVVAHNALFDVMFLNFELEHCGRRNNKIAGDHYIDTLMMGGGKTLDQLCQRFKITKKKRDVHGALIDAELLAKVYLELVEPRQKGLDFSFDRDRYEAEAVALVLRPKPLRSPLTAEDIAAHREFIATLKGEVIWHDYLLEELKAAA